MRFPLTAAVAGCLVLSGFGPALALTSGTWSELPPPWRYLHTSAFDAARDRLVIVGGYAAAGPSAATWTLSLSNPPVWALAPTSGAAPDAFVGHIAFADPIRDRMIISENNGAIVRALSLGTLMWTDVSASTAAPPGLIEAAVIYDPLRDRLLFFGGHVFCPHHTCANNDVWALPLDGDRAWQAITPAGTPPSARRAAAATYDPARDRMLIFGGEDEGTEFKDAWALDLAGAPAWEPIAALGPSPVAGQFAFYDAQGDRALLFGTGGPLSQDLWELTLSGTVAWSPLPTMGASPSARIGASVELDPLAHRLLLHGGTVDGAETWGLSLGSTPEWSRLVGPAPGRIYPSVAADLVGDQMIVFGGSLVNQNQSLDDTWLRAFGGSESWSQIAASGPRPQARHGHSAIVDPLSHRMIVFGGAAPAPLGDTWALALDGTPAWSQLVPTGASPAPRVLHSAIFDPVGERMLVFGGTDEQTTSPTFNDVWALSLGPSPAWSQLSAAGTPPAPRSDARAVYDSRRGRMLVIGGSGSASSADQVWALTLGGAPAWSRVDALGDPGNPGWQGAAYDSVEDRVVVFGPAPGGDDAWELTLGGTPQWTHLTPLGLPPAYRVYQRAAWDERRRRLIPFGGFVPGQGGETIYWNDSWALGFEPPDGTGVTPQGGGIALTIDQLFPNPSAGRWSVSFTLPREGTAAIELIDISGRRRLSRELGETTAGRHTLQFGAPAALPAGVYLLCVRQGAAVVARRVAVAH